MDLNILHKCAKRGQSDLQINTFDQRTLIKSNYLAVRIKNSFKPLRKKKGSKFRTIFFSKDKNIPSQLVFGTENILLQKHVSQQFYDEILILSQIEDEKFHLNNQKKKIPKFEMKIFVLNLIFVLLKKIEMEICLKKIFQIF